MRKIKMIFLLSALCSFIAVATIGCEKVGQMEKAGKKVDETVDSAKKAVDTRTVKVPRGLPSKATPYSGSGLSVARD